MNPELRELYQEVILDHGRRPRNFRELEDAGGRAEGHNPLCGDKLTVFVRTAEGRLDEVSFVGSGCAISQASASLMTEALRGKTLAEVQSLFEAFRELVAGESDVEPLASRVGKLAVFGGVREFPVRVKCATLAWHTLQAALDHSQATVSTE